MEKFREYRSCAGVYANIYIYIKKKREGFRISAFAKRSKRYPPFPPLSRGYSKDHNSGE